MIDEDFIRIIGLNLDKKNRLLHGFFGIKS